VYLPAGTEWVDAWTGKAAKGGEWFEANAPLERIPVYVRRGAEVAQALRAKGG
jgi:alpha-D-xyloside xylohydrolase